MLILNQILLLALYSIPFYFIISPLNAFIFFVLGLFLGLAFLLLDEYLLYKYYASDFTDKLEHQRYHLISRSVVFLITLIVLAFFLITSGGKTIGHGVVMGLALSLLLEMLQLKNRPEFFKQRFLWQVKVNLDQDGINLMIGISFALILIFNLLLFVL
ncbi:MAG: hypothetical protein PVJ09_02765 [Candidatus Woesebacteria bacterium]|jgi:hypothetical protein